MFEVGRYFFLSVWWVCSHGVCIILLFLLVIISHLNYGIIHLPILELSGISRWQFLRLVSQVQYSGWTGCADVQAGLALYWWHRLITFGCRRIKVKSHTTLMFLDICIKSRTVIFLVTKHSEIFLAWNYIIEVSLH